MIHSTLLVASNNQGKIREIKTALKGVFNCILSLSEAGITLSPEETGTTYLENARIKAAAAVPFWRDWILSDDSGLEVAALGGKPGIFSSRFAGEASTDTENNLKLLNDMKNVAPGNRKALFRCVAVLVHGNSGNRFTAEGICEGVITSSPGGTGGFGYDPIFYIPRFGRTMAELTFEEKMQISHRAKALFKIRQQTTETDFLKAALS